MLIYSKEPLNVMMKNILLLDDTFTDGYVYVNKETYDQALSLSITFNQDIGRVKQTISGKGMLNWAANKDVNRVVSLCSEHFSSPLNMLTPYLAYTLPIGVEWPEDNVEAIRMAYGVLHQMSQFVNFYATALMPSGAKAEITIPKNIIMSYEESWKAQLDTLDKCVVAVPVYVDAVQQTVQAPTPVIPAPVSPSENVEQEHEVKETNDATVTEEDSSNVSEQSEEQVVPEESTKPDDTVEAVEQGSENTEAQSEEKPAEHEDEEDSENSEEEDAAALEAKILAMFKEIEEAPIGDTKDNSSINKDEPADEKEAEPEPEKVKEKAKYGESGSINMTEEEIAERNRALLNDYDF